MKCTSSNFKCLHYNFMSVISELTFTTALFFQSVSFWLTIAPNNYVDTVKREKGGKKTQENYRACIIHELNDIKKSTSSPKYYKSASLSHRVWWKKRFFGSINSHLVPCNLKTTQLFIKIIPHLVYMTLLKNFLGQKNTLSLLFCWDKHPLWIVVLFYFW